MFIVLILDGDGDLVTFSTDDELMEALGFVNDGMLRIFIKQKGKINLIFSFVVTLTENKLHVVSIHVCTHLES